MAMKNAPKIVTSIAWQSLCAVIPAKAGISLALGALVLAACGGETTENITNINQVGMDVVKSAKDLPECNEENEGTQAFVKGETSARICVDGKWFATASNGGEGAATEFSCTTKELKDKSGLKIICNGDSIGVVLNGKDGVAGKDGTPGEQGLQGEKGDAGKDGADGKGCSIASQTDSTVTVACGTGKFTMSLNGGGGAVIDTAGYEVENASISGVSQKGPFVKGALVTAYELDGSKSLLQTGRTFSGSITQDDGRFSMNNVTLKSSYVRLSANGYYRNEVTGKNSTSPITLNAVTDLSSRNTVNVNLLTHLEFDRVSHLMGAGDGTLKIKQVKKQAEKEIFDAFHIDATDFGYSEDLDVFGNTDADAALLAISILLQGDRTESELTELLAELSEDLSDGRWDDAAKRAAIADFALSRDNLSMFAKYRSNVKNWELSTTVPYFEKYIRRFASLENGLGVCGSDSTPVGTVKQVKNSKSGYYAKSYTDTTSVGKTIRFICVDADSAKWRVAVDIETDRFKWNPVNTKDGSLLTGPVTGRKMLWDADTIRYANNTEVNGGNGCTSYNRDELFVLEKQYSYYKCTESGWTFTLEKFNTGTLKESRDGKTYNTIGIKSQNWMAENLNFKTDSSFCLNNQDSNCTKYGRLYTWAAAVGENEEECGEGKTCELPKMVRGVCPSGWHLPRKAEWDTLIDAVGGTSTAGRALKSKSSGWTGSGSGTNDFGFSALPAGNNVFGIEVLYDANDALFWSSTERSSHQAYSMRLYYDDEHAGVYDYWKRSRFSVRCLQD